MFGYMTFLSQLPSQYISCLQPLSFNYPDKDAEQGLSTSLKKEVFCFSDDGEGWIRAETPLKETVSRDGMGF